MCCARPPAPQASLAREVARALLATALGLGLVSAVAMAQVLDENAWVTNDEVRSIATQWGTTYLGGQFSYLGPVTGSFVSVGGATRPGLARIRVDMTLDPWVPDYATGSDAYDIARSGSTVYAVGVFESIGAQSRIGLAAIDASTGHAMEPRHSTPAYA